jgi:hypothetical protein
MILVRPGGVLGLVIALTVAALFLIVVRPAIEDTTRRAFDGADRMLSQGVSIGARGEPAVVIAAVKQELGPRAQLLDITIAGDSGSVKYRAGDGAKGYQWGPGHDGLEPVNVTLIGDGKLADNVFPIAKLDPGAPAKLTAAAKATAGTGFQAQSMMLAIDPSTGRPRWTLTGQSNGRTRVFTANSGANRLRPAG